MVKNKAKGMMSKSNNRREMQKKTMYYNSLLIMRYIGIVFHSSYSSMYANLNDMKKRKDFENGVGANNERFFKEIASIVNDNESSFHNEILPPPVGNEFATTLYDKYMQKIDDNEHPSKNLIEPVDWKSLKKINATLHNVYLTMKTNMSESGSHNSDAFNYTETAFLLRLIP